MTIHDIPTIMGALLIVAGITQVFIQMFRTPPPLNLKDLPPALLGHFQQADFGREGFRVKTAYPGMVMVCIGALLLLPEIFFGK